jgi:cell division protein FtsW
VSTDRRWARLRRGPGRPGDRFLDRPYASLQLLLLAGGGLLGFGVLMAASTTISASHNNDAAMWSQLIKEVLFVALGVPVFWLAVRLPPRGYRVLAYPMLVVASVLLLAVLVPGIGVMAYGARRWIDFGPLQFQPSEFGKLAVLVWAADLLARKRHMGTLTSARQIFLPLIPVFVLFCGLVMREPDLGTTMCFILILVGVLWMVGVPVRYFAVLVLGVGAVVTALAVLEPYRLQRLLTFTHPFDQHNGAGFQTVEGLYALASGGVFGVGLGNGTSKYSWVPNASTDYVYSVIGEELGLIGSVAVLVFFGLFAVAGMRIARRSVDPFVRLVAGGATVWICGQALINIGYVTALLPVTGIPLPFISAGGASLLVTFVVFGMLVSFARHEPAAVAAAQRATASGARGRAMRWARLPMPKAYIAPKRASRPAPKRASPPAPKRASPPAAARGSVPAVGRLAPADRTARTARTGGRVGAAEPAPPPRRPVGAGAPRPRTPPVIRQPGRRLPPTGSDARRRS